MLILNVNNLKKDIKLLNSLISDYEITKENLFNQLKNSFMDWHDEESKKFEENICFERQATDLIVNNLKEFTVLFNNVADKYTKICNKIKYDSNKYKKFLSEINLVCSNIDEIVNDFNSININAECSEFYRINGEKNKFLGLKNKLFNYNTQVVNLINKIKEIELQVNILISKKDKIKINDFSYTFCEKPKQTITGNHFINKDLLEKDIKYLNYFLTEERKDFSKIFSKVDECISNYNSNNSSMIIDYASDISKKASILINNRIKYIDVLNDALNYYINNSIL